MTTGGSLVRVRIPSRVPVRRPPVRRAVVALVGAALLLGAACSSSGSDKAQSGATTTTAPAATRTLVFNGQGNDLGVYLGEPPFTKQLAIHHNDEEHPDGLDINGQICFDPEHPTRFVAGEDTHQDTYGHPGWGIFEITDQTVGALKIKQVGKLVPTYQPSNDNPENYGCGFLPDGRILTSDVGNQATGPGDGQLIVWFPPFESRKVKYCKVDVHLTTGQGVLVDGDSVYVSQARRPGVFEYAASDFPTSNTADGGCDGKDATGAPMATDVPSTLFIAPSATTGVVTPAGIAKGPNGHLFVASVFSGVIGEYTADGKFVRDILKPPAGEQLGEKPFSTGTPLGVGVGPDGSLYYADIGIVVSERGIGPGQGTGKVRRITFDADGTPQKPEVMDQGLAFPDGIGIWQAPAS
jgi:hypothetical protein